MHFIHLARIVVRSIHQDILDRVRQYHATPAYHKAQRKRSVWVEPMFGEAKQWHNMDQFRLRRLIKVNIEGLLIAAGQNIKRLLRYQQRPHPLKPAGTQVVAPPVLEAKKAFRCFLSSERRLSHLMRVCS
jgi:hypothetical protein